MTCQTNDSDWTSPKTTADGIKAIKAAKRIMVTIHLRNDPLDIQITKKEALKHYRKFGAEVMDLQCRFGTCWLDTRS